MPLKIVNLCAVSRRFVMTYPLAARKVYLFLILFHMLDWF